jgi:hypothetical protein
MRTSFIKFIVNKRIITVYNVHDHLLIEHANVVDYRQPRTQHDLIQEANRVPPLVDPDSLLFAALEQLDHDNFFDIPHAWVPRYIKKNKKRREVKKREVKKRKKKREVKKKS